MAKITHSEALALQKQAEPLAKEVYRLNSDYKKYVAAFYLREHCRTVLRSKGSRVGRLTEGQIDGLFNRSSGLWNTSTGYYKTPLDDESYVYLYYMQRAYLAMLILNKKILASPQKDVYNKLVSIENQIIDFNNSVFGYRVESDGAALVGSPLSDYRTSLQTLVREVELIKEPDTTRYMFIVEKNSTARALAEYFYMNVDEFCTINKVKSPDSIVPAGWVYFTRVKK